MKFFFTWVRSLNCAANSSRYINFAVLIYSTNWLSADSLSTSSGFWSWPSSSMVNPFFNSRYSSYSRRSRSSFFRRSSSSLKENLLSFLFGKIFVLQLFDVVLLQVLFDVVLQLIFHHVLFVHDVLLMFAKNISKLKSYLVILFLYLTLLSFFSFSF
jgi:hypothetical protein